MDTNKKRPSLRKAWPAINLLGCDWDYSSIGSFGSGGFPKPFLHLSQRALDLALDLLSSIAVTAPAMSFSLPLTCLTCPAATSSCAMSVLSVRVAELRANRIPRLRPQSTIDLMASRCYDRMGPSGP